MTRRPKILIVEDDPDVSAMVATLCRSFADVQVEADGMAGLSSVRGDEGMPDLIITDVMMPRLDGLSFVRRVRATPQGKKIPIIVITSQGRPLDVVAGINAGARHYLVKPFQPSDLLAKVREILHIK